MRKRKKEELKKYGYTEKQIKEAEKQSKREKALLAKMLIHWAVVILLLLKIIVQYY